MTIVITGTTGFVGSELKRFLLAKNFTIIELNRLGNTSSFSFEGVIPGDCRADVWIHLAGKSQDVQKPNLADEYLKANVELTKKIFQAFVDDPTATTFIYASSVKAAAAKVNHVLTEEDELEVDVPYGTSKRMAEKQLLSVRLPVTKKLIILRPAMIYGERSKGNLWSLYSFVKRGLPYPFADFSNSRSLLSIHNFNYVIISIIKNAEFKAGIYNVADDGGISTNEIIELIGKSLNKKPVLWPITAKAVRLACKVGDKLHLPINSKLVDKLTDNYLISNKKLLAQLGENLPYTTREGLTELFDLWSKKSTK